MQTTYYNTNRMIWTESKIVDLAAYRRSLDGDLYAGDAGEQEESAPAEKPRAASSRADRRAWALDICASLGVAVMTLSFALHVLLL